MGLRRKKPTITAEMQSIETAAIPITHHRATETATPCCQNDHNTPSGTLIATAKAYSVTVVAMSIRRDCPNKYIIA